MDTNVRDANPRCGHENEGEEEGEDALSMEKNGWIGGKEEGKWSSPSFPSSSSRSLLLYGEVSSLRAEKQREEAEPNEEKGGGGDRDERTKGGRLGRTYYVR